MKPICLSLIFICFFSLNVSLQGQGKYLSTLLRDHPLLFHSDPDRSGGWLLYSRIHHGVANWNETGLAYRRAGYGGISSIMLGYEGIPGYSAWTADLAHGREIGKVSADLHIRLQWFHVSGEAGLAGATSDLVLGFSAGNSGTFKIWLHDWPSALLPGSVLLRSQPAIRMQAEYRPDHQLMSMVALDASKNHPIRLTFGVAYHPRGGLPFAFLTRLFPFGCALQTILRTGTLDVSLMLDYSGIPGTTPTLVLIHHE